MAAKHMDDELRKQRGLRKVALKDDDKPEHMEDELSEIEAGELWAEPTNLEAPPARRGYVQRWIRGSTRSESDPGNLAKAMRRGWKPRMADTAPDFPAPTIKHGEFPGAIGSVDCILCERPEALDWKEKAIQRARTRRQMDATVAMLQQNEHRAMPFEMENRSSVGKGSRVPKAAEDADND